MAAAIDPKKSITIINAFVVSTVQFLNQFAVKANDKLDKLNRQIQRLEALTQLLEYKLSSIPNLSAEPQKPVVAENGKVQGSGSGENPSETHPADGPPIDSVQPQKIEVPEEYQTYIRLVKAGVPREAIKRKIQLEGKDPTILDQFLPPEAE